MPLKFSQTEPAFDIWGVNFQMIGPAQCDAGSRKARCSAWCSTQA
jgi:hypothetical protein